MTQILIVDDSEFDCMFVKRMFRHYALNRNWTTTFMHCPLEALSAIQNCDFDILVVDVHMPKMSGLELLQEVRACGMMMPVVIMTADTGEELVRDAMRFGATDFVLKTQLSQDLPKIIEKRCPQKVAQVTTGA